ncbi:MAG: hypothetical protein DRI71_11510 [Bacteroidetes bacterium]|nr:MAG: hypothetical protein DRI71_11510 [Bacteroidota bacterium]
MKRLFILIGLIGVLQVVAGFNTSAKLLNPKKEGGGKYSTSVLSTMTPTFTHLDGNLFLAIATENDISIEDGDVVEFIFEKGSKLISFHVNEINQDLINTGEASLFVMVHNDLALKLRSHRLQKIIVIHHNEEYSIEVNKIWTPDQYMTSL